MEMSLYLSGKLLKKQYTIFCLHLIKMCALCLQAHTTCLSVCTKTLTFMKTVLNTASCDIIVSFQNFLVTKKLYIPVNQNNVSIYYLLEKKIIMPLM